MKKYEDLTLYFASCGLYSYEEIGEPYRKKYIDPVLKEKDITIKRFNEDLKKADRKLKREMTKELENQICSKCKHYYEGAVCGFELEADYDVDTFEDIKERRKEVCELDRFNRVDSFVELVIQKIEANRKPNKKEVQ